MSRIATTTTAILLWVVAGQAQTAVWVEATAPDMVGSRLVYAIKEGIRKSSGLRLVDRIEDSALRLHMTTLDPNQNQRNANYSTAYAIAYTGRTLQTPPVDAFITQLIGTCGADVVDQCAQSVLARTDQQAEFLRSVFREVLERALENTK